MASGLQVQWTGDFSWENASFRQVAHPPFIQLGFVGIRNRTVRPGMAMNRQAVGLLPALHGADVPPQVGRDLLPGLQAVTIGVRLWPELVSHFVVILQMS